MNDIRTKFMQDLERIEAENYQLREGEQLQYFVALMLEYIGDPQPELRDNLIYPTFRHWIATENKFTDQGLRILLATLIDEQHLFYNIGSDGEPSVFTRTFSVLPVALILRRHCEQPFLEQADFRRVKQSLLRYYKEEKDLRGYLNEGGWAHSAAHGADALDELVQCPESDEALQLEVLAAISGMLHNGKHVFHDEEDERIATIVSTMLANNLLPKAEIANWISGLARCNGWPRSRSKGIAVVNTKNFLRSLYFRQREDFHENESGLAEVMLAAERKVNRFVSDHS
ncbi:DUF2785 domain-containing protein [uncultured Brevibacillus sp.]|uniref:DUF2785 domain-containing protein n=1 Tax=uncultured Brevibacillus sp. TaxID=169970 RepID=UPI002592546C|nr:DUF2785 domain-containing protein [uncultured Brevibacillus sp.]